MQKAGTEGYPAHYGVNRRRSRSAAAGSGHARATPDLVTALQVGCALVGILCLVGAAIITPGVVRSHLAADGVVTASQAAALPGARLARAAGGARLVLLATMLRRFARAGLAMGRRLEWAIVLAPPVLLIALAGYKLVRGTEDPLYLLAVREDSLVETLTALAYFGVFVVACSLCRRLYPAGQRLLAAYYALIGVCGLFVALEEISYGQRLLGFATPDPVAARNVQREMTIHNLDFVERLFFTLAPLAVGLFGVLGVALAAARRRIGRRTAAWLSLLVPPWFLVTWFLPVALFALYASTSWGAATLIEWQDQEPLEALLAFGFLGFLLHSLIRWPTGLTR